MRPCTASSNCTRPSVSSVSAWRSGAERSQGHFQTCGGGEGEAWPWPRPAAARAATSLTQGGSECSTCVLRGGQASGVHEGLLGKARGTGAHPVGLAWVHTVGALHRLSVRDQLVSLCREGRARVPGRCSAMHKALLCSTAAHPTRLPPLPRGRAAGLRQCKRVLHARCLGVARLVCCAGQARGARVPPPPRSLHAR